jgi:hypothetical protein
MREIIEFFYNTVTSDSAMVTIMGSNPPRMYEVEAPPETKPPYLVHELILSAPDGVVLDGTWIVRIWDHGSTWDLIERARDRLHALFDQLHPHNTPEIRDVKGFRCMYEGDLKISGKDGGRDPRWKGCELRFAVRFCSTKDIGMITARS